MDKTNIKIEIIRKLTLKKVEIMRKSTFILTIATFLSINTFAQWETKYYLDDFGDPTEQSYKVMVSKGTFSNSATENSELSGVFIWDEKDENLTIKVYEYNRSLATKIEAKFISVLIKDAKGEVHTIKRVFFLKGGMVYFSKKTYKQLMGVFNQKGKFTMIFTYYSTYSSSRYKLKFELND